MLHRLFYYVILFSLFACSSSKSDPELIDTDVIHNTATSTKSSHSGTPVFSFDKDHHNFENVFRGEKVSFAFQFKNTGDGDLVISNAEAACGCTVPEYPKTAIKPGEKGVIMVTFDTGGRQGVQTKSIKLIANTVPNIYTIRVSANVIAPEK